MSIDLKGTGVALVTPFTKNNEVDYVALEKLVQHVISGGVNYLVVLGTTGESVTLSKEEKKKVVAKVIAVNAGRLPVVLGLGGNHTAELLSELKHTDLTGIDALLSVSPAYNRPSQEGIYQHYAALAQKSPLPILLYNVPTRTGATVEVETTLRLAKEFKNIVAMKDASAGVQQCMDMLYGAPEGFVVTSGDDSLALPMMALGAQGLISVIANAYPAETAAIVNAALKGDFATARAMHYKLMPVMKVIFEDGNPAGVKYFLHKLGLMENVLRLPLVSVKKETAAKIDKMF